MACSYTNTVSPRAHATDADPDAAWAAGAPAALLVAAARHGTNRGIVALCCRALAALANSSGHREELGAHDAHTVALGALTTFPSDDAACECGAQLALELATDCGKRKGGL